MESGAKARELLRDLAANEFHQGDDGALTIKDVKLLASGTWTDSVWGTPLFYPEEILKEYAENWFDNPLWVRHGGGVPRAITDKIGEVVNPRYHDGAVHGDLFLHGKNSMSRDSIEMVTAGLANAVSVEHGGREIWDEDTKSYIAEEIIFYAVALVNRGACDTCTFNNESRSTAEADDMDIKELETKLAEAAGTIKELSDASADKDKKLSELEGKLETQEQEGEEDSKIAELEAKLEAKILDLETKKLAELEARIEKIEKTPLPGATLAEGASELGEITIEPLKRDSEGITRRMF